MTSLRYVEVSEEAIKAAEEAIKSSSAMLSRINLNGVSLVGENAENLRKDAMQVLKDAEKALAPIKAKYDELNKGSVSITTDPDGTPHTGDYWMTDYTKYSDNPEDDKKLSAQWHEMRRILEKLQPNIGHIEDHLGITKDRFEASLKEHKQAIEAQQRATTIEPSPGNLTNQDQVKPSELIASTAPNAGSSPSMSSASAPPTTMSQEELAAKAAIVDGNRESLKKGNDALNDLSSLRSELTIAGSGDLIKGIKDSPKAQDLDQKLATAKEALSELDSELAFAKPIGSVGFGIHTEQKYSEICEQKRSTRNALSNQISAVEDAKVGKTDQFTIERFNFTELIKEQFPNQDPIRLGEIAAQIRTVEDPEHKKYSNQQILDGMKKHDFDMNNTTEIHAAIGSTAPTESGAAPEALSSTSSLSSAPITASTLPAAVPNSAPSATTTDELTASTQNAMKTLQDLDAEAAPVATAASTNKSAAELNEEMVNKSYALANLLQQSEMPDRKDVKEAYQSLATAKANLDAKLTSAEPGPETDIYKSNTEVVDGLLKGKQEQVVYCCQKFDEIPNAIQPDEPKKNSTLWQHVQSTASSLLKVGAKEAAKEIVNSSASAALGATISTATTTALAGAGTAAFGPVGTVAGVVAGKIISNIASEIAKPLVSSALSAFSEAATHTVQSLFNMDSSQLNSVKPEVFSHLDGSRLASINLKGLDTEHINSILKRNGDLVKSGESGLLPEQIKQLDPYQFDDKTIPLLSASEFKEFTLPQISQLSPSMVGQMDLDKWNSLEGPQLRAIDPEGLAKIPLEVTDKNGQKTKILENIAPSILRQFKSSQTVGFTGEQLTGMKDSQLNDGFRGSQLRSLSKPDQLKALIKTEDDPNNADKKITSCRLNNKQLRKTNPSQIKQIGHDISNSQLNVLRRTQVRKVQISKLDKDGLLKFDDRQHKRLNRTQINQMFKRAGDLNKNGKLSDEELKGLIKKSSNRQLSKISKDLVDKLPPDAKAQVNKRLSNYTIKQRTKDAVSNFIRARKSAASYVLGMASEKAAFNRENAIRNASRYASRSVTSGIDWMLGVQKINKMNPAQMQRITPRKLSGMWGFQLNRIRPPERLKSLLPHQVAAIHPWSMRYLSISRVKNLDVRGITPNQIWLMRNSQFAGMSEKQVGDFKSHQIKAMWLGQFKSLDPAGMKKWKLDEIRALNGRKIRNFEEKHVGEKGFEAHQFNLMTNKQFRKIKPEIFAKIHHFAGMDLSRATRAQVRAMNPLKQIPKMDQNQLAQLCKRQPRRLGSLSTAPLIRQFDQRKIQAIKPELLAAAEKKDLRKFSAKQVGFFTPDQIAKLCAADRIKDLRKAQIRGLVKSQFTPALVQKLVDAGKVHLLRRSQVNDIFAKNPSAKDESKNLITNDFIKLLTRKQIRGVDINNLNEKILEKLMANVKTPRFPRISKLLRIKPTSQFNKLSSKQLAGLLFEKFAPIPIQANLEDKTKAKIIARNKELEAIREKIIDNMSPKRAFYLLRELQKTAEGQKKLESLGNEPRAKEGEDKPISLKSRLESKAAEFKPPVLSKDRINKAAIGASDAVKEKAATILDPIKSAPTDVVKPASITNTPKVTPNTGINIINPDKFAEDNKMSGRDAYAAYEIHGIDIHSSNAQRVNALREYKPIADEFTKQGLTLDSHRDFADLLMKQVREEGQGQTISASTAATAVKEYNLGDHITTKILLDKEKEKDALQAAQRETQNAGSQVDQQRVEQRKAREADGDKYLAEQVQKAEQSPYGKMLSEKFGDIAPTELLDSVKTLEKFAKESNLSERDVKAALDKKFKDDGRAASEYDSMVTTCENALKEYKPIADAYNIQGLNEQQKNIADKGINAIHCSPATAAAVAKNGDFKNDDNGNDLAKAMMKKVEDNKDQLSAQLKDTKELRDLSAGYKQLGLPDIVAASAAKFDHQQSKSGEANPPEKSQIANAAVEAKGDTAAMKEIIIKNTAAAKAEAMEEFKSKQNKESGSPAKPSSMRPT